VIEASTGLTAHAAPDSSATGRASERPAGRSVCSTGAELSSTAWLGSEIPGSSDLSFRPLRLPIELLPADTVCADPFSRRPL